MDAATGRAERPRFNSPEAGNDERWRTAFENSAIGISLLDLSGRFVTVNSAYQKMLGYTEAELQTMSCPEITLPEDRGSYEESISELLAGNRSHVQIEKRLRQKNGTPIWTRLNLSLVPGSESSPPFLLAVVEDITQRKTAEDALGRSEALYKEVLDNTPECVFAFDVTPDFRFRFAWLNQAEERAVGLSSAEVNGRFVEDVLTPEVLDRVIPHYLQCVKSGAITKYEEELNVPAGRRYFYTTLIPLRNSDGDIYRIIGCCSDLTEIRRAQDEALARQKLESLGILAAGIAHDFNNLLGSILTNAELAETQMAEGGTALEEIRTIKDVAIRTAGIVRELIVYAGQEKAELELTDVSQAVEEMLILLKVSISKRATLHTNLEKDLPAVRVNAAKIRQILMNLIVNASESLGQNDGTISIKTSLVFAYGSALPTGEAQTPHGEYVRLEVSDTGCGIPEEARARIFDPFFTTKFAGRGLGLAVVQGIVRAHGGSIDVRSNAGRGTTFEILMPGIPASLERRSPKTATVLFVEDEETLRHAVSQMLRRKQFSVIEAGDGWTALDLLRSHPGDICVLLLDMTLPGIPSKDLIQESRRLRPDMKIILTSAYHQETISEGIESPQIRAFIRKPFLIDQIVRLLRDILGSQEVAENQGISSDR